MEMAETAGTSSAARVRMRALIVPREHGAWGLLLIPLFTGMAAGIASAQGIWTTLMFAAAALSLFWLRTPVESLLGASPLRVRNPQERRIALMAAMSLAAVSAICLTALLWRGRNPQLLRIGGAAAFAFVLQAILRKLGRSTRMAAQLAGAVGLTATAPAAYYVATGELGGRALALWLVNWLFAGNQIHFVHVRIHASQAAAFSDKFARGWFFFLAQPAVLLALVWASWFRHVPVLIALAFLPATVRGTRWFFQKPKPLNIQQLGWSEMKQGIAFGILAGTAFFFS